jgi:hypothetical protein
MRKNYGYKICFVDKKTSEYIRYFITYTYLDAVNALNYYIRYPPKETIIKSGCWKIKKITKSDFKNGIWNTIPFTLGDEIYG